MAVAHEDLVTNRHLRIILYNPPSPRRGARDAHALLLVAHEHHALSGFQWIVIAILIFESD